VNILDALTDSNVMAEHFSGSSWEPWRAILAAAFGLPLTPEQAEVFSKLSGGREPPQERVRELFVISGRRCAKSHTAAAVAVYIATIGAAIDGALNRLSRGERGVIALLAVDRKQAGVLAGYIRGLLAGSSMLSAMVERDAGDSIDLTNNVTISIMTNSFRAVRGRTLLCAVLDECAFYRSETTQLPDVETYRALVPALATTGGLLVGVSSPYSRKGLLWAKYKKHFGQPGDVLVLQAGTRDLNPGIDQRLIDEALADDPQAARAEWLGQFREDVELVFSRETIESLVDSGVTERAPVAGVEYFAFVDPSGGRTDSMVLAVAHRENNRAVLDLIVERKPPFDVGEVVGEFAAHLKRYRLSVVEGDRYGAEWVQQAFMKAGVRYEESCLTRSDIYSNLLPVVSSGACVLLDCPRLVDQLVGIERRTSRTRPIYDHGPGASDDTANAAAGALIRVSLKRAAPMLFEFLDVPDARRLDPPIQRFGAW
jgi:hypothetical protein